MSLATTATTADAAFFTWRENVDSAWTDPARWLKDGLTDESTYESLPPGDPDALGDSSLELDAFISVKLGDLGRAARLLAQLESRPARMTGPGNASTLAWLASELAEARGDRRACNGRARDRAC